MSDEQEIADYVRERGVPVICCGCPGCKDPTLQRHRVKTLLRELERAYPGLKRGPLGALSRVDAALFPIPRRRRAGPGVRLPLLGPAGVATPVLAAGLAEGLTEGG